MYKPSSFQNLLINDFEGLNTLIINQTYRVLNRTLFTLTEHPDNLLTNYLEVIMKNCNWIFVLVAIIGLIFFSCSDETSVPVASISSNSISKMGDDMHSATGNGHWRIIGDESRVRFSFSAIQHGDGSFSGQVRNNDQGPTFKFHGVVYNLLVDDNLAKICFTFTSGVWTPPGGPSYDLTGCLGCVVVVDNDEINEVDRVSLTWFDPPGTVYPTTPPMTIEEIFAQSIDDYINTVINLFGLTYDDFLPEIEQGSVHVR
jgi:hypothetical protein